MFMIKVLAFLLVIFSLNAYGQSRRVAPGSTVKSVSLADEPAVQTVKQMWDEAFNYWRVKFTEFEQNKVPFSESLRRQTLREQKLLAAKYAALVSQRTGLTGDDLYFHGMLHWLAENYEGAAISLRSYAAVPDPAPDKLQTSRSILVVIDAKQRNFEEAEKRLAEYLKTGPVKLSERSRMENELAKAYLAVKQFDKASAHAAQAFDATKTIAEDPAVRAGRLNQLLDDAVVLFEAHRDGGKIAEADSALEELRKAAAAFESTSIYYYAVDNQIKYMIATGRKPQALEFYARSFARTTKDFPVKERETLIVNQLKKREKHYKLLGETAPELDTIDQWFPGQKTTLAALRGKVVLLDFWATWCAPCFEAFPHLSEWAQEYKADGLYILGLTRYYGSAAIPPADRENEIASLKRFKNQHKLNYDFAVTTDQTIQRTFGATSLPTAVIIDRKGVIRYVEAGSNPSRIEDMRLMILKLLAEK